MKSSKRAELFVTKTIKENHILMSKMVVYYLSQRGLEETLKNCIRYTENKDKYVVEACEYFNILPPIQEINDFSYALLSFMNELFNNEQVNLFTNRQAIDYLMNNQIAVKN
jgi:thermostable 8-oxoguanine DNA glycosylase